MNKHLLLALLFIPLIHGCESTSEETSTDVAAVIPGIQWEVHHWECGSSDKQNLVVATGIDWDPVVITGTEFDQSEGKYYQSFLGAISPSGELSVFGCNAGDKGTIVLGY